jgi:DNA-binding LacI/PurR family transcriptional regulator
MISMAQRNFFSDHEKRRAKARTTLKDVCRRASVSKATVSRVLNNRMGVALGVRRRVLKAMKELGYVPQAAARSLSRARSDTLGIVFQDLTAGWLLNVFRGIMHVASTARYNVVTALSTTEGDELDLPQRLLSEGRVDGLLWFDPRVPVSAILDMKKLQVPLVVLQRNLPDPDINTVSIENFHGAYEAVRHLLQLGCRDILLVTGAKENEDSNERYRGAVQAFRDMGVELNSDRVLVGHNVGALAVRAFDEYLAQGHTVPRAIFAFNDDMAIHLMNWLQRNGRRIPQDVAIVGFDGVAEAECMGLTTVETPMYELGTVAAQMLVDIISGSPNAERARQVLLKGCLRIRESCGAVHRHKET